MAAIMHGASERISFCLSLCDVNHAYRALRCIMHYRRPGEREGGGGAKQETKKNISFVCMLVRSWWPVLSNNGERGN